QNPAANGQSCPLTSQTPLSGPRGGVESLDLQYCALQHRIQDCFRLEISTEFPNSPERLRSHSTICVWVTIATSLPSSVSSRVVQTWVRRPRCTGVAVAMIVVPSFAPPMKLVLLSSVVVPLASSGKLMTVAAAPTESAKAITAPP